MTTAPGSGLSGGATSGAVDLNVNFAGTGTATTVARSDHGHARDSCSIYSLGNTSIVNSLFTIIAFNSETIDTNNLHSTTSNASRITIQQAGTYFVGVRFAINTAASGSLRGFLLRNASTLALVGEANLNSGSGSAYASIGMTGVFQLNAGDYLELTVFQTSGGALSMRGQSDGTMLWVAQQ